MRIILILIALFFSLPTVHGQGFEPLQLAKRIFAKDSLPGLDKYVTGEYKGRPNGQDLQNGSVTKFLLLSHSDSKAVVAMTILDASNKGIDTYLHFEKDTIWKMSAFRGLALTGIIEQLKVALEKMTPQEVDSIIEKSKSVKNKGYTMFTSREDYNFKLGNARLTLELDENIVNHFLKNQSEFERIKNLALQQLEGKNVDEYRSIKLIENSKADYQKLFISSISTGGHELGNCLDFLIGGMVDNSVGYMYVKDKKDLPEMSSDRIIMIREIGNGWYLYKTT